MCLRGLFFCFSHILKMHIHYVKYVHHQAILSGATYEQQKHPKQPYFVRVAMVLGCSLLNLLTRYSILRT